MVRTLVALVLLLDLRAGAQIPAAASTELQALAARAQVIFTGQVAAVERNDGAGFVDVRFRIDRSLRGAPASGTYVVREWAGLWMAHPDRYTVGERRLMLLSARSAAGFSAPVGDLEGAIPLLPTGSAGQSSPGAGLAADLRWVEARGLRATGPSVAAGWNGPVAPLAGAAQAAQPVPLTAVLALLGGAAPTTVLRGPLHAR